MIASANYDYARIREQLEKIGCTDSGKVVDLKSQPHHFWVTPWGHGFLVPGTFATDWEIEKIVKRNFDGTRPKFND